MHVFRVDVTARKVSTQFVQEFDGSRSGSYTIKTELGNKWKLRVRYSCWCAPGGNDAPVISIRKTFDQVLHDLYLGASDQPVTTDAERDKLDTLLRVTVGQFENRHFDQFATFGNKEHVEQARRKLLQQADGEYVKLSGPKTTDNDKPGPSQKYTVQ